MKQSKLMSWVETCLNTGIGFVIAMTAQVLVFPLFGFHPPLSTNFYIACIFTVVSILRGFVLRRVFEALHIRRPLSPFITAAIEERFRQIEKEGWSLDHDDNHDVGELARAGACYARCAGEPTYPVDEGGGVQSHGFLSMEWPWSAEWWKPAGFRRDLVKATALIIAEGEKFDRNRKPKART